MWILEAFHLTKKEKDKKKKKKGFQIHKIILFYHQASTTFNIKQHCK